VFRCWPMPAGAPPGATPHYYKLSAPNGEESCHRRLRARNDQRRLNKVWTLLRPLLGEPAAYLVIGTAVPGAPTRAQNTRAVSRDVPDLSTVGVGARATMPGASRQKRSPAAASGRKTCAPAAGTAGKFAHETRAVLRGRRLVGGPPTRLAGEECGNVRERRGAYNSMSNVGDAVESSSLPAHVYVNAAITPAGKHSWRSRPPGCAIPDIRVRTRSRRFGTEKRRLLRGEARTALQQTRHGGRFLQRVWQTAETRGESRPCVWG
jgi:hypothetical protein